MTLNARLVEFESAPALQQRRGFAVFFFHREKEPESDQLAKKTMAHRNISNNHDWR